MIIFMSYVIVISRQWDIIDTVIILNNAGDITVILSYMDCLGGEVISGWHQWYF